MIKKYFLLDIIVSIISLIFAFIYWYSLWGINSAFGTLFVVSVLAILEISLSFDNAIVNVNVLKGLKKKRRQRFLTRWILIAVFWMRIIFPIILVSIFAGITPRAAVSLDFSDPSHYAAILEDASTIIAWFGGAFLMMVGLRFFLNKEKNIFWLSRFEKAMKRLWKIQAMSAAIVLWFLLFFSYFLDPLHSHEFLSAGVRWIILYIVISGLSSFFSHDDAEGAKLAAKTGLTGFIYLEILDASFSLDGVIWAFAISTDIVIIALWLGIGAFFVRSFTIFMYREKTLKSYRYLEHGAFYAVLALALMMFLGTIIDLPEVVIGGIWLLFIIGSFYRSWTERENKLTWFQKLSQKLNKKKILT